MSHGPELVLSWALELQQKADCSRIQRIEGADSWCALAMGKKGPWLFLSWDFRHYGCCLARSEEILPLLKLGSATPPIVASLKRHLLGASLKGSRRLQQDRILELCFRRPIGGAISQDYHLIFESADRFSNLLLADGGHLILEISHHIHPEKNRYRSLVPGLPYTPPPPFPGIDLSSAKTEEDLMRLRGYGRPLLKMISRLLEHDRSRLESILDAMRKEGEGAGTLRLLEGHYLTVLPEEISLGTPLQGSVLEESRRISLFPLVAGKENAIRRELAKEIEAEKWRLQQRLQGYQERLRRRDCADSDRLRGQALLAFSHQVPGGASSVELPNPEGLDDTITVLLDPRKDPAGNAQIYFKRYRKALDNAGGAEREIDRLEAKMEELDVERAIIDKADLKALFVLREERHPAKNRSKKNRQTPSHLCLDYDGCRILVGLTAKGNRFVTFDQASREDIWFHARNLPGAHVILKCPSEDIPDGAFEVAASLAAHYSRGAGDEPVTIDYTEKKHVRHIPGKGPAHVTYRNFASVTISPGRWREKIEGIEQAPPVKGNGN